MPNDSGDRALDALRRVVGPDARFHPGQLEAIDSLVRRKRRVLVVQRTGWGKSAVYLIATRLLLALGFGATVIISPLLALMRNQIEMAGRLGLVAETVNSSNRDDWQRIFALIGSRDFDLLLISPERLNNPQFRTEILSHLISSTGLLVIDEAHCISDWGHDFRPDYRRLAQVVAVLPPGIPVLGTTATANDRVIRDVQEQLGDELLVIRGTLERESLALQVIHLPQRADRLAWLATVVPTLPGSGIIYCLTVRDARRVAEWLKGLGLDVVSYTGEDDSADRLVIEEALSRGAVKAVVATSALGMGYDNPRIQFVVHYQSPGSPVAYYQQVGRAGRAVDRSLGILLSGEEDVEIQDYFIRTAFPQEEHVLALLGALERSHGLRKSEFQSHVNLSAGAIDALLKVLEVERAVYREGPLWYRSAERWEYPRERVREVTKARESEQRAMQQYVTTDFCLMDFLRSQLDDPEASPCGRCANCVGGIVLVRADPELVAEAQRFVRRGRVPIPPRWRWPSGIDGVSLREYRVDEGRALCVWGDTGWGEAVRDGKYSSGHFGGDLVDAVAEMIGSWDPQPRPSWIAFVPDRKGDLVASFADRLASKLGITVMPVVRRVRDTPKQKTMRNSHMQARNVRGAFVVDGRLAGAGLLFDDMVDSRWTFTELGSLLRFSGADVVYPVALADTSRGDA